MNENPNESTESTPNERIADFEQLVWALLDQQITEDQFRHLEQLISNDEAARKTYFQCVQLHCDLGEYFANQRQSEQALEGTGATKSPVLGFLNQAGPGLPLAPPLSNPPTG